MAILIDFHVLAQALLYLFSVACGLVVSIPLGVTTMNMKGCILYLEVEWKNASFFTYDLANQTRAPCNVAIYLSVFAGIMYAFGMAAYYTYAVTRKDPNIGAQMWVVPFTLVNTFITVTFFIAACMISVGFKTFCDSYTKNAGYSRRCKDAEKTNWNFNNPSKKVDASTFYEYVRASEGACWVMFFAWVAQVGLGIARFIRNRRLRSQGMYADSPGEAAASGPGGKRAEDLTNVAAAEPTA
ncbi:transmembrane protein 179-like [Littorina saxatilis]|uniref:Uncharacterized protein n=1 Tax=Littorina saxatilis TaxID=31220 RepID=A0AAN9BF28_9CAEN